MSKKHLLASVLASSLVLAACSDSDSNNNNNVDVTYQVKVTNLTNAQPFSPIAVIAHQDGWNAFTDGSAASDGLEQLAEGGANAALISEAEAASQYKAHTSGTGPLGPKSESGNFEVSLTTNDLANLELTLVTMLVNTNDAITALNAETIGDIAVGESRTYYAPTWDAGTELNTEAAGTIPGPADGGTGFDSGRETLNVVRIHSGVISQDDGLAASVLTEAHRFDNPTARIVVTRTE